MHITEDRASAAIEALRRLEDATESASAAVLLLGYTLRQGAQVGGRELEQALVAATNSSRYLTRAILKSISKTAEEAQFMSELLTEETTP